MANALQASVTFVEALGGTTHAYGSHPASTEDLCCELDGRLRVRSGELLTLVAPPDAPAETDEAAAPADPSVPAEGGN